MSFIVNCIIISMSVSVSNIVSNYIIETYIKRHVYVTMVEFREKINVLEAKIINVV